MRKLLLAGTAMAAALALTGCMSYEEAASTTPRIELVRSGFFKKDHQWLYTDEAGREREVTTWCGGFFSNCFSTADGDVEFRYSSSEDSPMRMGESSLKGRSTL